MLKPKFITCKFTSSCGIGFCPTVVFPNAVALVWVQLRADLIQQLTADRHTWETHGRGGDYVITKKKPFAMQKCS